MKNFWLHLKYSISIQKKLYMIRNLYIYQFILINSQPNLIFKYFTLILQTDTKIMEKSMVHELNGLAGSQFFNRSTFITTAYNQGDYQLRKSRIQNLPSYRKQDLSSRIQFVVVFQTIEIQRLSTQIEALRIALKDAQRQNFNIHSYQVQIRELTQKCHNYESQRQQYLQENDRMNIICQRLYEQLEEMKSRYANIDPTLKEKYRLERQRTTQLQEDIQKWKTRYSALEHSKNRQMEDMRMMMESQRKSMIDREIKEITLKFNSQRSNLQNQIRKLRQNISMRDGELQRLHSKISQLQIINQQMRHYEETINQYENKFGMISQETIRLNELLRAKQQQIQRYASREEEYKRRINKLERDLAAQKQGGQKVRQMQKVVRDWQVRYSRLEDEKRKNEEQLQKIPQFQITIRQISRQAEKMKDAVKQKMRDNEQWRFRYDKLMSQFNETKKQQQSQIPMLENRLNQVNSQNTRINEILKNRTGELQNWKNKCGDFEKQLQRVTIIEQQKKDLGGKLQQQIRYNNDLQNNNRELMGKLKNLQFVTRTLEQEKQQKQECLRQIDRLNGNLKNMSLKHGENQKRCQNLQRQLQSYMTMQQQIQVYKKQEINLTRQIDRINGIINQKIKQIQNLKDTFKKLQHSINQYQGMEQKLMNTVTQMQNLMQALDESRKQSGFYQQKLMMAEGEIKKSKNQLYVLNQEKEQAVKLYNTKSRQFENVISECQQLRGQVNILKQKQARGRQFQEKFRTAEAKISEIERKFSKERLRSQQLNSLLERATEEMNKIKKQGMLSAEFKQQFMQVKYQSEQKEREIKNLILRINQLENIIKRLKQVTMRNDQICKRNHQKWMNIDKQIDIALKLMQKTIEMQNQIYRLNEENMKLQSKNRLLSVQLNCENTMKKSSSFNSNSRISSQISISGLAPKKTETTTFGFRESYNGGLSNVTSSKNNYSFSSSSGYSYPFKQTRDIN